MARRGLGELGERRKRERDRGRRGDEGGGEGDVEVSKVGSPFCFSLFLCRGTIVVEAPNFRNPINH